ncbi:DUF805 domain-containing protein [Bradyrhizobium sp. UFLA05-109]
MDWIWLLFRIEGRINRARFWLAMLVIICGMLLLITIVAGIRGLFGGPWSFKLDALEFLDPATYRSLTMAGLPLLLTRLLLSGLLLWVYLATSIKRLHDRDKSGWWSLAFIVFPALYPHVAAQLPAAPIELPLALAALALSIWGFVEIGCLRGTPHTNLFGPNPLPKIQTRTRHSGASALPRGSGWHQQSELEFVPHSASPPDGMHVKRGA